MELTDNEGTLLGLVLRQQSITAYQLSKVYEDSPVSSFNTSKGKIYPLIRRLEERGWLVSQAVKGDARGTNQLSCTDEGRRALRRWVLQFKPSHLLLEDPLRTKVQSFDLFEPQEQIEWLLEARTALTDKLAEVELYGDQVTVPYKELVHDNAVLSIKARIEWLDRALHRLVKARSAEKTESP